MFDPKTKVAFAAVAVAMKAKARQLSEDDVTDLVTDAQELLVPESDLRAAVTRFSTQYELYAHDPEYLRTLGYDLHHAISMALMLTPQDLHRKDVHG